MKKTILILIQCLLTIALFAQELQPKEQNGKYGFVNMNDELIIDYKYDAATLFNYLGLSKVSIGAVEYFIDEKGTEYKMAKSLSEIGADTKVFVNEQPISGELPKELFNHSQLEILILKGTYTVPKAIKRLKRLRILVLKKANIKTLPKEFGKLRQLQILDISYNQFQSFPMPVTKLKRLKRLHASSSHIDIIPDEIKRLKALEIMSFRYNKIEYLSANIGKLQRLKILEISNNQLKTIPESLKNLQNLTILNLGYNQLNGFPKSILALKKLEQLNLDECNIKILPDELTELKYLAGLDLYWNHIEKLPENIGQLKQLQYLDLEGNKIKTLPKSFGQLTKLKEMSIDYNELTGLPDEFCQLKSLTRVWLSCNAIRELPKDFGQLSNLTHLYLDFNQLETVPESFAQLTELKRANFKGNRLSDFMIDRIRFGNRKARYDFTARPIDYTDITEELFEFKKHQRAFDILQEAASIYEKNADNMEIYSLLSVYALFVNQPHLTLQTTQDIRNFGELEDSDLLVFDFFDAFAYLLLGDYLKGEKLLLRNQETRLFEYDIFLFEGIPSSDLKWKNATLLLITDLEAAGVKHQNFVKIQQALNQ